ncbi:Golgin candidate 2 [Nymphaea thermarum]|nr:Golgin candidate 2 [Nymphaea thermarum]
MANWLSSKLKVAESLLQQIDQQAAESLRKNEKSRPETVNPELPMKAETVPLRDQFKKKNLEKNLEKNPDEVPKTLDLQKSGRKRRPEVIAKSRKTSPAPSNQVVNDGDWTELLGSPESIPVPGKSNSAVDKCAANETKRNQIHGLNQTSSFVGSGPKHTQIDSALLETKKVHKQTSFGSKLVKDFEVLTEKKVGLDALASDFGKLDRGLFTSIDEVFMKMDVESRNVPDGLDPSQLKFESYKQVPVDSLAMVEKDDIATGDKSPVHRRKYSTEESEVAECGKNFENCNVDKPHSKVSDDKLISPENGIFHERGETSSGVRSDDLSLPNQITSEKSIRRAFREKEDACISHVKENGLLASKHSDTKIQANGDDNKITVGRSVSVLNVGVSGLQDMQRGAERFSGLPADEMDPNLGSSESEARSSSDSESGSPSDSDNEGIRREERKRRQQLIAEAAAVEAIREHDSIVAMLEEEKQHLEEILEEREKEQVQEASKLQSNMEEVMEAVELEKQKHNSTRMEAMARLSKLETANAELARSLASTQWELEKEELPRACWMKAQEHRGQAQQV